VNHPKRWLIAGLIVADSSKKDIGEESMIILTVAEAIIGDQDREGHYGRRL